MKITFLENSGFAVEAGDTLLAFDVCTLRPAPGCKGLAGGALTEDFVRGHKRSVLLLSHSHSDHYCREVFRLPFSEILLSRDFPEEFPGTRLSEGEETKAAGLTVHAFGSTDLGVSYLVCTGAVTLFHAGDYNLWHWEEESTAEEIREAERDFARVLDTLRPFAGKIDVAFFPLDPRMGRHTDRGAERFLNVLRPKVFVPMHSQGDTALPENFARKHPEQVRTLTRRGQVLEIEEGGK